MLSHSLSPLIGKKLLSMFSLSHHHVLSSSGQDRGFPRLDQPQDQWDRARRERGILEIWGKVFTIGKAQRGIGWRLQVELKTDAIMSSGSFGISHRADKNTERCWWKLNYIVLALR